MRLIMVARSAELKVAFSNHHLEDGTLSRCADVRNTLILLQPCFYH
jgi:hypothetical protein